MVPTITQKTTFSPNYLGVWRMFFRNSLIRSITFRANFLIEAVTQMFWVAAQIMLFDLIYRHVPQIQDWNRYEYFGFMATSMLVNAFVEAFFMPNCANFSELIRTGNLDFALLKPIDTQFLVSFATVDFSMINQILMSLGLLWYSLSNLDVVITPGNVAMYLMLVGVAVAFFYSLMISMASTSIWLGRNQSLYDFWFYMTVFARYPQNFYRQANGGEFLWFGFSFIIPILLVITVPARVILGKVLEPNWFVILVAPLGTFALLMISRCLFQWSLSHYRSASS